MFNNKSECHASTIKYLKKMKKIDDTEKDCKVDLILFNHGYGDMFTCEDKRESASPGIVQNDLEKATNSEKNDYYTWNQSSLTSLT